MIEFYGYLFPYGERDKAKELVKIQIARFDSGESVGNYSYSITVRNKGGVTGEIKGYPRLKGTVLDLLYEVLNDADTSELGDWTDDKV